MSDFKHLDTVYFKSRGTWIEGHWLCCTRDITGRLVNLVQAGNGDFAVVMRVTKETPTNERIISYRPAPLTTKTLPELEWEGKYGKAKTP